MTAKSKAPKEAKKVVATPETDLNELEQVLTLVATRIREIMTNTKTDKATLYAKLKELGGIWEDETVLDKILNAMYEDLSVEDIENMAKAMGYEAVLTLIPKSEQAEPPQRLYKPIDKPLESQKEEELEF